MRDGNFSTKVTYTVEKQRFGDAKTKARRKWQNSWYPLNKAIFNRLNNQLNKRINVIKIESISNFPNKLSGDNATDYSIWKAAGKIEKVKNCKYTTEID